MPDIYKTPVTALPGVGAARAEKYKKLGIVGISDLLYAFPRAYENRGDIKLLIETDNTTENEKRKYALLLTVASVPKVSMIRRGMVLLKFRVFDESASAEITFFNQNYLRDKFHIGEVYRFWGYVERIGSRYSLTSPQFEPYTEGIKLPDFLPVYRQTAGLSGKQIAQNVASAFAVMEKEMADPLPEEIRTEHRLCTLSYAIRNIHRPTDMEAVSAAKKRLIFDEFFIFALGIKLSKKQLRERNAAPCIDNNPSPYLSLLPFAPTEGQAETIREIAADMSRDIPMNRIVIGDVGCGKTICAAAAIYIAIKNGGQAALMVPTEILARQHYAELSEQFSKLGIKTALLIGASTPSEKKSIKAALVSDLSDRIDVVIGTQALLSDGTEFSNLTLIVTDEQHRFGALQRAALSEKAVKSKKSAHMLVMSATPIPRTFALTLYGDLDISRIEDMPKGRQRVDTFAVNESYRARLDAFIRRLVGEGGQVYIVCPAVEEAENDEEDTVDGDETPLFPLSGIYCDGGEAVEKPPLKAAVTYAAELASRLSELNIAFIHGKMKAREKDAVMRDFCDGKIQVLVSTTVIEVGVNVPNACLMIIENAERFGLSQLHQLRGRVGRGNRKSYCILVSECDTKSRSAASERLNTMCTIYDGYKIAEKDLALRGPGDFFKGATETGDGIRQSGGLKFRLADLCDDVGLFSQAFAEAEKLTQKDASLSGYPLLLRETERLFSLDIGTVN